MIELGDGVKGKVTGFQGVVVARCEWLYGCTRLTVQPPVDQEHKIKDTATFDEPSLALVKHSEVKVDGRLEEALKADLGNLAPLGDIFDGEQKHSRLRIPPRNLPAVQPHGPAADVRKFVLHFEIMNGLIFE